MNIEVTIIDTSERGIQVAIGDGAPFWIPRSAPGLVWAAQPEPGDVVYVRVPAWLASKHRQLTEFRYQRSMALYHPGAGLDPIKKSKGTLPMADYPQSFPITRMFRKASKEGRTYFTGRLGGAKIALLKSRDVADDGGEIWNLVISEAPKRDDAGQRQEQRPQAANTYAQATGRAEPQRQPAGGPSFDDDNIPF